MNGGLTKDVLEKLAKLVCKYDKANKKGKPEFNMGRARKAVALVHKAIWSDEILVKVGVKSVEISYHLKDHHDEIKQS